MIHAYREPWAVKSRQNPLRGKWTVNRLVKRELEVNDGEMHVEDLLDHMQQLGYLKEPLRRRLKFLDVEIVDGMVRIIG